MQLVEEDSDVAGSGSDTAGRQFLLTVLLLLVPIDDVVVGWFGR